MRIATSVVAAVIVTASIASAAPSHQTPFNSWGQQNGAESLVWDPLEHMSGIAPYHDAPGADLREPRGCEISASTYLIRHGAIAGNDEEYEEYMQPFQQRMEEYQARGGSFDGAGPLAFLKSWKSLVSDESVETLTGPGETGAFQLGKRLRKLYPTLFPPKNLGSRKDYKKSKKPKTSFKVWTASSSRDIDTAKAFVRGAFPKRHEGDDGEGDGRYVQLVKVPNKDPHWRTSLTPHKVCPRFSKEVGKPDARTWLSHYAPAPLERFRKLLPEFDWQMDDIIAMQMYCGYETVIKGDSEFCKQGLFTEDEFRSLGYFFDIYYDRIVGYSSPVAPYLGLPWLKTSTHNLLSVDDDEHPHFSRSDKSANALKGDPRLPDPDNPPNATHTQRIFVYFSHREEPPVALVALGIWNQTAVGGLPLDSMPPSRVWQTSHVLPFLGHVALQRIECGSHSEREGSFVQVVVNGAVQPLPRPELSDGPGKSCELDRFKDYVDERAELFGDFEGACKIEEDHDK